MDTNYPWLITYLLIETTQNETQKNCKNVAELTTFASPVAPEVAIMTTTGKASNKKSRQHD